MRLLSDNLLTVFTPTYNRAGLLERCYNALLRQSDKDFVWIIVDDGSTDNTKIIVEKWILNNNAFQIEYYYKNNGGLHTAYNVAVKNIHTELCVCIDSDDYPSDNCVETIKKCWLSRDKNVEYAGIFGLNRDLEGNLIGGELSGFREIDIVKWTLGKYDVKAGDKKLVVRTDLYKQFFPMAVYPGEKNFNPNYANICIGMDKPYIALNECLCYVDYQDSGMTNSMLWQYYNSPNSFAEIRLLYLSLKGAPLSYLIRHSIHYTSSCILSHRKRFISKSSHPIITGSCLPLGFLLSRYIVYKNRGKK